LRRCGLTVDNGGRVSLSAALTTALPCIVAGYVKLKILRQPTAEVIANFAFAFTFNVFFEYLAILSFV
jgi:LytS/YehU family sensor histidine kinase